MPHRTAFFNSDGTGITAETFANAILAQFEIQPRRVRLPFVDDADKAYQAVQSLAQANPNLGALFMPEANSALGAAQAKVETKKNIKVMCCDVNAKILDMIKSGDVFGAINPNQGMQGYMGMMMLFLAKNPGLIDPMNDAKRNGTNPMAVPFLDNGLAVVSKANADDFYWDKYLARRGTKGISE